MVKGKVWVSRKDAKNIPQRHKVHKELGALQFFFVFFVALWDSFCKHRGALSSLRLCTLAPLRENDLNGPILAGQVNRYKNIENMARRPGRFRIILSECFLL